MPDIFCFAALFAVTEPRILTHTRAFSNTPRLVALRGSVPRHSVDVAGALTHTGCIASRYDSAFTQTRSVICTQLGFAHSSVARLFPHHGPWLCGVSCWRRNNTSLHRFKADDQILPHVFHSLVSQLAQHAPRVLPTSAYRLPRKHQSHVAHPFARFRWRTLEDAKCDLF